MKYDDQRKVDWRYLPLAKLKMRDKQSPEIPRHAIDVENK